MSPKAKVVRDTGDGDEPAATEATPAAPVDERVEAVSERRPQSDPSPFDSAEFLDANRRNRDKMRAAAAAKRAKQAAREQRRGRRWWGRPGRDRDTSVSGVAAPGGDEQMPPGGEVPVRRGRSWAVPVLSVLLVAALVAAGIFAYLYREADDRAADAERLDELRPGAVELAGRYAAELLTYDSADFAELDSRITDISTPAFAKDFIESSRQAREGSASAQAIATASVKEAGVQSISATEAVVLVALDQLVKSPQTDAQLPDGIPYQSIARVTLQWVDGGWLLSDLDVV